MDGNIRTEKIPQQPAINVIRIARFLCLRVVHGRWEQQCSREYSFESNSCCVYDNPGVKVNVQTNVAVDLRGPEMRTRRRK